MTVVVNYTTMPATMSGIYSGLQARIKNVNPLAEYAPCSAHSLNLVGTCSAECCPEAISFFSLLQLLYNFFIASTYRWEVLQKNSSVASTSGNISLKSLSQTRWSARDDACKALMESWSLILNAIMTLEQDLIQKASTRNEAKALRLRLERLETAWLRFGASC